MSELRPPRAARPQQPPAQEYGSQPSPFPHSDGSRGAVQFTSTERGDRHGPLSPRAERTSFDPELADPYGSANVGRKKSLVRPDREKIEPGHRQWYYRQAAAQMGSVSEDDPRVGVYPSTTGNYPRPMSQQPGGLRRGKSLLGREEDVHESGLALFKRGATLRRKKATNVTPIPQPVEQSGRVCCFSNVPGPTGPWTTYCYLLTACMPSFLLRGCGIRSREQQRAWREKMGLLSIILVLMAGVGYLTFGFTKSVCGKPPNRYPSGGIDTASVIIHGYDYDFDKFKHPSAGSTFPTSNSNPLYQGNWGAAGNDISFMFQKVNDKCLGLMSKGSQSSISGSGANLDWYFPCNIYNQKGNSGVNITGYDQKTSCHTSTTARGELAQFQPQGQVFYTWDQVRDPNRNLAVYESQVLDLNLLQWLSRVQVNYPSLFDEMKSANGTWNTKDISMYMERTKQQQIGHCLQDLVTVGFIDTNSIGCVASSVVLYLSLVFIVGVVLIRFGMAVMFQWFFSWRLGNFPRETYEQRMQRSAEIENWSNDIYRPAPSEYRPNVSKKGLQKGGKRGFLPSQSRFTPHEKTGGRPSTAYGMLTDTSPSGYSSKRTTAYTPSPPPKLGSTPPDSPGGYNRKSRSTSSFMTGGDPFAKGAFVDSPCPFPLHNVVPQPPPDYEPFNYPLAHTICLVTAYSESIEGLRTTLDSLATTDYPNSHKLLLVIADGMVKGSGNAMTTPEICLSMMKDLIVAPEDTEAHSYVAIADGHKRHNMAKVYAGFYEYDDATVERSKQQRVPIVLVAKVGNPLEQKDAKPGNRGKRDSQIVLMGFLQKVMFDERMTTFEYEFFNSIWRVTGVSPDRYELVLCVDADTKVFPDSLTRMVSCCVCDHEIMGLCGETKIANKSETFVTMMQVFEYYISHHMTKAFESMFGGVTCLPGCFSMYRIKAPKGDSGYWVPILANPDIVEHYSENVVDTLHKKNLLLLGEDRYLTTLMLKTFPKRKNMFCPQAVCKTVVPDTFRVLLSQRRRWINSTIHNLAELVLVRDLCGTFCFSMQFVVAMELAGTLVLPAAISFTLFLIIDSAIPGGTDNTIPLILLAIVLGLPGILIVVTSRKVAYIWWMLVYLLSLPIWNGILPAYAFWHFDDFSWGQTRKVAGERVSGSGHGDKEGEFDSSHIVMKRWAEFERDRRWRSGTASRDSVEKADNNRYSMASYSDSYHPPSNGFDTSTLDSSNYPVGPQAPRSRHDSNTLLVLPTPLAVNSNRTPAMSSSSTVTRLSDDGNHFGGGSESNMSQQRLIPSPGSMEAYSSEPSYEGRYDGGRYEPVPRVSTSSSPGFRSGSPASRDPFSSNVTSPTQLYDEPQGISSPDYSTEESVMSSRPVSRGVRLMDSGPVPGPEGVRRVSRSTGRRPTSQVMVGGLPGQMSGQTSPTQQNRYSRNSQAFGLPPGAAAPQPGNYGS